MIHDVKYKVEVTEEHETDPPIETRNEGLMKQAARLLGAAGGYRNRHYLIKVENGRAVSIEEFKPPQLRETIL